MFLDEQTKYLKKGFSTLRENWDRLKLSVITLADRIKFDAEMSELAKGNHYEQFLNLFRRMKARNALSPFKDDDLIGKSLIIECLREMDQTMDEQALFEPPKFVYNWPKNIKIDPQKTRWSIPMHTT